MQTKQKALKKSRISVVSALFQGVFRAGAVAPAGYKDCNYFIFCFRRVRRVHSTRERLFI